MLCDINCLLSLASCYVIPTAYFHKHNVMRYQLPTFISFMLCDINCLLSLASCYAISTAYFHRLHVMRYQLPTFISFMSCDINCLLSSASCHVISTAYCHQAAPYTVRNLLIDNRTSLCNVLFHTGSLMSCHVTYRPPYLAA